MQRPCAAALRSAVRDIFVRTILGWLRARAAAAGTPGGSSGAVVLAQRFGGALNLNLHFHARVLDGVYTRQGLLAAPRFQPASDIRDGDVAHVTAILHRRIVRYIQRRLAVLVPRPRAHLLTYHGVLAPAAQWRDRIVPGPRAGAESHHGSAECARAPPEPEFAWSSETRGSCAPPKRRRVAAPCGGAVWRAASPALPAGSRRIPRPRRTA